MVMPGGLWGRNEDERTREDRGKSKRKHYYIIAFKKGKICISFNCVEPYSMRQTARNTASIRLRIFVSPYESNY